MLRLSTALGLVVVTCSLGVAGCKSAAHHADAEVLAADGGGGGSGDPDQARAQYYKTDRLVEVDITMSDWDDLANAQPIGGKCNFTFTGEPYPTHKAQEIKVDGHVFKNVAIKKSSNCGSISSTKPNLKVSLDKYDPSQANAALAAIGTTNLILKNSVQDQSLVRQCLGAELIAKAGGPRNFCNFAKIVVNGKTIGVYVNLEPSDKMFVARNFGKPTGNLYEVGGEELATWALDRFKNNLESFKEPEDTSLTDMKALINAATNDHSADLHDLNKILDVDQFVKFWAMEVLLTHWDGLTNNINNSLIYFDPKDGRAQMMLRGIDQTFTDYKEKNQDDKNQKATEYVFHKHTLAKTMLANSKRKQQFKDMMRWYLDNIWHEDEILGRINTMSAIVSPLIPNWNGNAEPKWSHDRLVDVVKTRKQDVGRFLEKL